MLKGDLMALSEEDVRGIAQYARIGLNDAELSAMTEYLNEAIELLRPIVEFEPNETNPTSHPIGDLVNVMRDDTATPGLDLESALENAHSLKGRYFRVPSILGGGGLS